jgi:hypothetical protein
MTVSSILKVVFIWKNHINGTVILQWVWPWRIGSSAGFWAGPKLESQAISTAMRNVGIYMPLALPWCSFDDCSGQLGGRIFRRLSVDEPEATTEGMLTPARDAPLEGMLYWVAYAATGIEVLAVAIIVIAILMATVSYLLKIAARQADRGAYN